MVRISSIKFDGKEQPKRATIITDQGRVNVHWVDDYGDRNWFTSGSLEAQKLAVSTIERIERMVQHL